jgi:predicted nuclease of predicted toxin-antitoxin system
MRFLADMGISRRVVEWLRSQGHDAKHLREQGLQRLPDGDVFRKAADEKRVLLTFDLDFGEILAMSATRLVSAVLFRLNNTSTAFLIRRLAVVLDEACDALNSGAIIVVEDARYRIRRLPLTE